jgi:hypothetical protein
MVFKRTKAINFSLQATSVWFKRYCAQFKSLVQTSLYQGTKQCQTTIFLEQLAGASPAFNAMPSQRELVCNAEPLLQREKPSVGFMVGPRLDRRPSKADNVALRLKPFMAMKRVKRETI